MIQYGGIAIIADIFTSLIGYIFTVIIIGSRVSKRVIDKEFKFIPRDLNKDTKMMRISVATSVLLCAFLMIFIK
ncbi:MULTISPECIES: hypothetical protein [unclassified Clostridium]|uniref:hypothetical protein n=1 Tax=unclassified Clostridium TaxID=2614128 RepID=UPI001898FC43|nr:MULTISPECIES: hypothetical protein [unclassified Clostridium]MCR1950748.1 hypothetical protein [Clostridium sp. DSM 100503]